MPVQVFPKGPPPPPPVPQKSQLNAPPANGTRSPSLPRKSPQPQAFERPDMANIIPTNPMATLKKVGEPKPKNDFWVEEYKRERSKSPMPPTANQEAAASANGSDNAPTLPQPVEEFNSQQKYVDHVDSPKPTPFVLRQQSFKENESDRSPQDHNNNHSAANAHSNDGKSYSPQQRIYSPFSSASPQPNLPKPLSPVKLNPNSQDDSNVPIYVRSAQRAVSPKPMSPLAYEPNRNQSPGFPTLAKQPSFEKPQTPIYTRTQRQMTASPVRQYNQVPSSPQPSSQPSQQQLQQQSPQIEPQIENVPIYVRSFQKQNNFIPQQNAAPKPLTTSHQTFNGEPGRQYYQPSKTFAPNEQPAAAATPPKNHNMPPWMMRRTNSKEIPEWAGNVETFERPPSGGAPSVINGQMNNFNNQANHGNEASTNGGHYDDMTNKYAENKVMVR